jgi:hypothetical protein
LRFSAQLPQRRPASAQRVLPASACATNAANTASTTSWPAASASIGDSNYETAEQLLSRLLSSSGRRAAALASPPQATRALQLRQRLTPGMPPRQRAEEVVRSMWALHSTWRNRAGLFQRLQQHSAASPPQSLDWAVTTFVESTAIATSGRLQYAKDLVALLARMGHALPITRMYMSGLRSAGALIPNEQAHPIEPWQVLRSMQLAHEQNQPALKAGLFLAFKAAARWSDINRLQRSNIKALSATSLTIHWADATKTTAAEPFAIRGLTVVEHPAGMQWLVDYLNSLRPAEFVSPWATDRATAWMKRNTPQHSDPAKQVTASSFKRGAVTQLVVEAARGRLDPMLISRLAKHKNGFEEISATTVRYVAPEVWDELAHVLRTQEATRLLLA